jgi:hypothetical protein
LKLPYAENAFIPDAKVTNYLLNTNHPRGKDKAAFFIRYGFSASEWNVLRDALLNHGSVHDVASVLETPQGIHYAIDGELNAPDGRSPQIRTIWALDTDSTAPRLITAYPLK